MAVEKILYVNLHCLVKFSTYVLLPPDDSLTLHSVAHAVATVRQFWGIGLETGLLFYLGVPRSVMDQIRHSRSYSSEEEKRVAGLQYCLQTVPGVSWGRIAGGLWFLEEHTALETVRQYLPHTHGQYENVHVQYSTVILCPCVHTLSMRKP